MKVEMVPTRDGFGHEMVKIGKDNPNVVMVSADLEDATRAEYFKKAFPERFFSVGIAEQDMVSMAAGLAHSGLTVVINSFAVFMTNRAYDQIRIDVCYNKMNVKIVCSHAGLTVGEDGATAQSLEDLALMRVLPGMKVICPADHIEAAKATQAMITEPGPVFLRTSRAALPVLSQESDPFVIGKAKILQEGRDVTLIGCGMMVSESMAAARILAEEGIKATVVNMHTIKPLDAACLKHCCETTGAIVTAEEHQKAGGLGSAVAEFVVQHHPVPMAMIGVDDSFGETGKPAQLLEKYGLTAKEIAEAARQVVKRKS